MNRKNVPSIAQLTAALDEVDAAVNADRRTGPEDRRQSADGSLSGALRVHGMAVRASSDRRYGLRKGDKARWVEGEK